MNCVCCGKTEKSSQRRKKKEKLPRRQRAAHGVGHVLNDLVSSVWFSYLIIYLTKVVELSNRHTGLVILLGQIADGIFTPFIGIICDRTVCRYGRRKLWHLIGTVLVTATFPLLLIRFLQQRTPDILKMVYYVGIAAVFQFGWGCVQISHLALIPEISRRASERVELNAIRYVKT
jgi:Na+/melibiose symporter-like transporter